MKEGEFPLALGLGRERVQRPAAGGLPPDEQAVFACLYRFLLEIMPIPTGT